MNCFIWPFLVRIRPKRTVVHSFSWVNFLIIKLLDKNKIKQNWIIMRKLWQWNWLFTFQLCLTMYTFFDRFRVSFHFRLSIQGFVSFYRPKWRGTTITEKESARRRRRRGRCSIYLMNWSFRFYWGYRSSLLHVSNAFVSHGFLLSPILILQIHTFKLPPQHHLLECFSYQINLRILKLAV
jgi:hypothetical protein